MFRCSDFLLHSALAAVVLVGAFRGATLHFISFCNIIAFSPMVWAYLCRSVLRGTDSDWCLALCQIVAGHCQSKESSADLEKEIAKLQEEIAKFKGLADAVMSLKNYKEAKLPRAPAKKQKEEPLPIAAKGKGKGSSRMKEEPKGKGKGRMDDDPRSRGGKGKSGKGDRDRDYYYMEPPPLRQMPKGGKGGKSKGGKGKY